jgi:2-C-methyl-D-erythritol 4-phosphate cytidylyltransferase
MGNSILPKQYLSLHGKSVLQWSMDHFEKNADINFTLPILHPDDMSLYEQKVASRSSKRLPPCTGGIERTDSVYAGLMAIERLNPTHVLIHDAARPATNQWLIQGVLDKLITEEGIIPALSVADTLRRKNPNGTFRDVDRTDLHLIQTPQGFPYLLLKAAYELYFQNPPFHATDDASIYTWAGHTLSLVQGCPYNLKLTHPDDLTFLSKALS